MSNAKLHQKWYKTKTTASVYKDNKELSKDVVFHLKEHYKSNTYKIIATELNLNLHNVRNWYYKNTGLTAFELLKIMDNCCFIRRLLGYYKVIENGCLAGKKNRKETKQKILAILKENPKMTMNELACIINITPKAVEWQIKKLVNEKKLLRVGATKNGMWLVMNSK